MGNFKIKEFRKAKGLFQEDLASVIGLTQSNLSRYENNAIDLSDAQFEKLYEKYGKEAVDAYKTDSTEQVRNNEVPMSESDKLSMIDLVTIIKKQNDTICQQVEAQNDFTRQLTEMNKRLLDLLEKIHFE